MNFTKHFLNIPAVYNLGTRWVGHVPTFISYTISQTIASLSYLLYKPAVNNVKNNLSLVFPNASEKELSAMTKKLLRNYSKYLVDYGRFTNSGKDDLLGRIVNFDGRENLESALQMNKGLILLTAHLGNWELGGIFFGNYGLKTNVVTIQDEDSEIDTLRRWYREKHKVNTITIGDSPFSAVAMMSALNNGEIVAMLIDRYHDGLDSITVEFFGRPTKFPRGPLILSRVTKAPIVTAFVVKDKDGYRGIIGEPIVVADEHHEREVLRIVVKMLEKYIIMYPDQWYNFTQI